MTKTFVTKNCRTKIIAGALLIYAGLAFGFSKPALAQISKLPPVYRTLVNHEQLSNDRVENTKEFASIMQIDVSPQYWPEKQPIIPLQTLLVPLSDLTVIDTEGLLDGIIVREGNKKFVPFFVHPDSAELYAAQIQKYAAASPYMATPTSSHRSMVVWQAGDPKHPLYIKLSINRKIGGDLRILTNGQMERAAAVSYLLKTMDQPYLAKKGIHFIDEPLHIFLNDGKTGYSLRTFPELPMGHTLVPMFALYSKRLGQEPMIAKLISQSSEDPKTFLRRHIIQPLISDMMELAFTEGIVGDFHEQNVLMEMDGSELTGDFYYRDLAGFDVNTALRAAAGKTMDFLPSDFDRSHLHFFRADTIQKIQDYLVNSNFYALRRSLQGTPYEISKEWLDETVMKIVSAEMILRTGTAAHDFPALKGAITKYLTPSQCRTALARAG